MHALQYNLLYCFHAHFNKKYYEHILWNYCITVMRIINENNENDKILSRKHPPRVLVENAGKNNNARKNRHYFFYAESFLFWFLWLWGEIWSGHVFIRVFGPVFRQMAFAIQT